MDTEQVNRLNERDKQDFRNRFQNASYNGKGVLNSLLCAFIASHECKFMVQNLEPPSIIDNYKIDTSPYRPELDKEFENILSNIPENQAEMRNQYRISSPEEKVLLKQALDLLAEMLRQETKHIIKDMMKQCAPEELEEFKKIIPFQLGAQMPYRIQLKELNEFFEQIEHEENLGVQKKFEIVQEKKKTDELTIKYYEQPTQSKGYYMESET